jgi:hypothetical protein
MSLAAPDAFLVLGLENEFSLRTLLDRRVPADRHDDEDWMPRHHDRGRPVSADRFADG